MSFPTWYLSLFEMDGSLTFCLYMLTHFNSLEWFNVLKGKGHTIYFTNFVLGLHLHLEVWLGKMNTIRSLINEIFKTLWPISCWIIFSSIHLYTEKLNLTSAHEYKYLGQSNCYSINGVDDAERFHSVKVVISFITILSYSSSLLISHFYFVSFSRLI